MSNIAPERERILTVTIHDCEVQTFRAGGKGGQNQNKVNSGVRVIHHPSGARGEARDSRDQPQNKRNAFIRMVDTPAFRYWVAVQTGAKKSEGALKAEIERELADPSKVKVEVRGPGGWVEVPA